MSRRSLRIVAFLQSALLAGVACSSFDDAGTESADSAPPDATSDAAPAPDGAVTDAPDGDAADASTCACPGRAPCGLKLVSGAGAFCIDPHEVSQGAYADFVGANLGKTLAVGAPCAPVVVSSRPPGPADLPVANVTFCEARAYCAWAGKRLCGHVAGRPLANGSEHADREQNAWLKACAGDGSQATLSGACRRALAPDAGPAPVKTTCEGAFPGLFDLQGNVWEWVDAPMVNDAGAWGSSFFGGSWGSAADYRCAASGSFITSSLPDVGFRCCSP